MADGLAAIALVGNIIQFISFGSALLSKSREIRQSASGLSSELVDLEHVSKDIKRFSNQLLTAQYGSPQLHDIAKSCAAVAGELSSATTDIKKHDDNLSTKVPSK